MQKCVDHLATLKGGKLDVNLTVGEIGIDSLTILDWLFFIEDTLEIEITASMMESLDFKARTPTQIVSMLAQRAPGLA